MDDQKLADEAFHSRIVRIALYLLTAFYLIPLLLEAAMLVTRDWGVNARLHSAALRHAIIHGSVAFTSLTTLLLVLRRKRLGALLAAFVLCSFAGLHELRVTM